MVKFDDVKNETTEEYFKNNTFAVDVFNAKYAKTKEDGTKENPAEVFYRVSSELAKFEDDDEYYRDTWFYLMYIGWFRPGGSIISGVGSDKKISLANCTTLPVEGDTLEDISKAEYSIMKAAATRQGIGIGLSSLRPRGAKLGNAAEESTGAVPWGKKFSDIGLYVGQCIDGNVEIFTDKGELKIKDVIDLLEQNEEIYALTHKGFKEILNTFKNGKHPLYRVETSDGNSILATKKHKFIVDKDKSFVELENLTKGDLVQKIDPKTYNLYFDTIENIQYEKDDDVYNIEVDDVHLYFANGFYTKNSGRQPAILEYLDIGHPDIEEFITSKRERGQIENANISVHITDKFMNHLENNEDWPLQFNTHHETITRTANPKHLMNLIAESAAQSAEPGVQFIDSMKRGTISEAIYKSTGNEKYKVIGTNACCFTDDTQVTTNIGTISIREIIDKFKEGKTVYILSYDFESNKREYQKLETYHVREHGEPQQLINIEITDGTTIKNIKCTPDHKTYTVNRGWVEASELSTEDQLQGSYIPNTILNIAYLEEKYPTFNLQVAKNRNYFAEEVLVKNSEKPLPAYSVCNLLSINMEMFSTDPEEYKQQLRNIVKYLVRFSDNVVQYELDNNLSPISEQHEILSKLREIGLGFTNLHGWLLKDNVQYDSDEAIQRAENFMKWYSYYTLEASIELAKEKGNAPAFNELKDINDLMESTYINNLVNEFFDGDCSKITHLRNLAQITLPPTGSNSNIFPVPCISSGIEPVIGPWWWRRTRAINKGDWDYYFVVPNEVKNYILNFIPEDSDDYNKLKSFEGSELDNDGKIGIEIIDIINKYITEDFFKPAHQIDPNQKIKLLGRLYKWIDAAISCTFNLPPSTAPEDIKNIYINAYYEGVRAVSVYKEGSREGILIFEDPITHKKKYSRSNSICNERPESIVYQCAPKRPKELDCKIHHTTCKGEKWLVLIGLLNGKPYELFAGTQEDLYMPKTVEEGVIVKNGKGKYNLKVNIRNREVEHKDIANVLMSAEQRTITRILSTCLRHGVPTEFLTEQLKKAKEDITDFASAVSRVLSKYDTGEFSEGELCPLCGEYMIPFEGCLSCSNPECYYQRCS